MTERDPSTEARFAVDWPEAEPEGDAPPAPDQAAVRLAWTEEAPEFLTPSEPESAEPAPSPPPSRADQVGTSAFRIRLRSRPDPLSAAPIDPHQPCRDEIERLEAQVAELRREVETLRRRAQVRQPSD